MFFVQRKTDWRTALMLKMVTIWLVLSASGCAWLNDQQRLIIYRPTPSAANSAANLPAVTESLRLDVPHAAGLQHLALWWLPNTRPNAPTLLYLHGTFRNLQGNVHKILALREAGFSVLAVDYRGWGQSSSIIPSEQTILQDARLAWAELVRREPRPAQRLIYGHSMGSGVAVDLASHLSSPSDYGGLILESAFTSFADVAFEAGWRASLLSLFNPERFASIDKIGRVHAPLLMMHGDQDDTIPIRLGKRLFDAANQPKQWQTIAGGHHSDLDEVGQVPYQQALQTFTAKYLEPSPALPPTAPDVPPMLQTQ